MLFQGVLLGLSLSFMIGPLLFSLIQAALEGGTRAGLSAAIGIWISDVLFVFLILYSLQSMADLTAAPHFKLWAGVAGGAILILFGAGSLWSRAAEIKLEKTALEGQKKSYKGWFLRGFLLNTINPFTVFFWLGLAGAVIVPNHWGNGELLLFFGGMFGTLICTDLLKIYLAKKISEFLTKEHVSHAKLLMGLLLIIFGGVLIGRVL